MYVSESFSDCITTDIIVCILKYKYSYKCNYSCFINVFVLISQNCNYVQAHCNDRNNLFHFACHT